MLSHNAPSVWNWLFKITKVSQCLTVSIFIASIRDFVDPHTDDATLKQWIIEHFGRNFSFRSSPLHRCFCYRLPAHFRTSSMANNDDLARSISTAVSEAVEQTIRNALQHVQDQSDRQRSQSSEGTTSREPTACSNSRPQESWLKAIDLCLPLASHGLANPWERGICRKKRNAELSGETLSLTMQQHLLVWLHSRTTSL